MSMACVVCSDSILIRRYGISNLISNRSMKDEIKRFTTYLIASDTLLNQASKEEIADGARVLAFHLGHYRTRYGDVPTTETLHLQTTEKITDEMAVTLVSGVEALTEVLKATGSPRGEH